MKRKRSLHCFRLTCFLLALLCFSVRGSQGEALTVGSQLPQFTLPAPESEQARAYLGLKTMEPFALSAVNAKVILVEFMSATCTHCLANAPIINRLYRVIERDPALAKDVKMIGIALGGDKTQTNAFKKTTKTPFPIFTDEKLDIAAAVDIVQTPTMVLVSRSGKTLASHSGEIKDFDGFLKKLREITKKQ